MDPLNACGEGEIFSAGEECVPETAQQECQEGMQGVTVPFISLDGVCDDFGAYEPEDNMAVPLGESGGGGGTDGVPSEPGGDPVPVADEVSEDDLAVEISSGFAELGIEPASVEFQPDLLGFGYVDRHTNVYADVEEQVVTDEILGEEVEIRATPVEYRWDYGDGASRTTSDPGGPLPETTPDGEPVNPTDTETGTSHMYTETGRYPVTVETVFSAEFRLDDEDWVQIDGTASLESSPGEADIWRASTRHVSGECDHLDQWGCDGPVELEDGDTPPEIFREDHAGD